MGEIASLCAMADVVHEKRPVAGETGKMAAVENDDIAHAVVRFRSGARGVLSSSRIAHGRKNGLKVEVHGSKGMLWLDNERMNELNLYVAEGPGARGGFAASFLRRRIRPMADYAPHPDTDWVSTN